VECDKATSASSAETWSTCSVCGFGERVATGSDGGCDGGTGSGGDGTVSEGVGTGSSGTGPEGGSDSGMSGSEGSGTGSDGGATRMGAGLCNSIGDVTRDSGSGVDEGDKGCCMVNSSFGAVSGASEGLSTGGGTGETLDDAAGVVSPEVSPMVNVAALSRSSRVILCARGRGGLFWLWLGLAGRWLARDLRRLDNADSANWPVDEWPSEERFLAGDAGRASGADSEDCRG
jgi:hypothetical protein